MPDIIAVLTMRWKLILTLTLLATVLALVVSLLRPKEYLATATALPANSATSDKARIYNTHIEGLYSEIGGPDELDKIEGTADLDTIYLAVAEQFNLPAYYQLEETTPKATYQATTRLRRATDIRRSAYGELKIKVWDRDPLMAAQLANALLQTLNEVHQHIQNVNNARILQKLNEGLLSKQKELDSVDALLATQRKASGNNNIHLPNDTLATRHYPSNTQLASKLSALQNQVKEYQEIISRYELAVRTTPQVLIAVETARPPIGADKPKIVRNVLFALAASFIFSFLLALLVESRKQKA